MLSSGWKVLPFWYWNCSYDRIAYDWPIFTKTLQPKARNVTTSLVKGQLNWIRTKISTNSNCNYTQELIINMLQSSLILYSFQGTQCHVWTGYRYVEKCVHMYYAMLHAMCIPHFMWRREVPNLTNRNFLWVYEHDEGYTFLPYMHI